MLTIYKPKTHIFKKIKQLKMGLFSHQCQIKNKDLKTMRMLTSNKSLPVITTRCKNGDMFNREK